MSRQDSDPDVSTSDATGPASKVGNFEDDR